MRRKPNVKLAGDLENFSQTYVIKLQRFYGNGETKLNFKQGNERKKEVGEPKM